MSILARRDKPSNLHQAAQVYIKAFSGWPWFEIWKDSAGNFYGHDHDHLAKVMKLTNAYDEDEVAQNILTELETHPFPVYSEISTDQLCGIGWGYGTNALQLARKKYRGNSQVESFLYGIFSDTPLSYISEMAIEPNHQGNGLGSKFMFDLTQRLQDAPVLMRTRFDSPMARLALKLGYLQIMGPVTTLTESSTYTSKQYSVFPTDPLNPN